MVEIKLLTAGFCYHPEKTAIRDGSFKKVKFPALFALIKHQKYGYILFDTGYSRRFYAATRKFPSKLYALLTPVHITEELEAKSQLAKLGITADMINYIIISHFHADHIGGLPDFANAKFIYLPAAYNAVAKLGKFKATLRGFLPELIPADFAARSMPIDCSEAQTLFNEFRAYDIFADSSILGVELPGHAAGQMGLLLKGNNNRCYFLVADACWLSRSYQQLIYPHAIANLIMDNSKAYRKTLNKIHHLHQKHSEIVIVPSHQNEHHNQILKKL